jgi:hypothetical protein
MTKLVEGIFLTKGDTLGIAKVIMGYAVAVMERFCNGAAMFRVAVRLSVTVGLWGLFGLGVRVGVVTVARSGAGPVEAKKSTVYDSPTAPVIV